MTKTEKLDVVSLTQELVRLPSHPGIPRQEEKTAKALVRYLKNHGIEVSLREVQPGRPNLIAGIGAKTSKMSRHLLLCGHTDTVGPNKTGSDNLFSGRIEDGRLHGRGSVDMKGALAAMAGALVSLKNHPALSNGKITFAAVVDEEMASIGTEALIRSGIRADGAIVGESTNNRVAAGHKGLEWLEIEFLGKASHGGAAHKGINAISAAAHFIRLVEEELVPSWKSRRHPLLGFPEINMGTISGGDQPSTVAARCVLQLDRRWLPSESAQLVLQEIEELLERVRLNMPGLVTRLGRLVVGMDTMVHGPLETALDHLLVLAAQKAHTEVCGQKEDIVAFPAWTDAALLSREAGIPSIVLGPGDLAQAHSPEEFVSVKELEQAVQIYTQTAVNFLQEDL